MTWLTSLFFWSCASCQPDARLTLYLSSAFLCLPVDSRLPFVDCLYRRHVEEKEGGKKKRDANKMKEQRFTSAVPDVSIGPRTKSTLLRTWLFLVGDIVTFSFIPPQDSQTCQSRARQPYQRPQINSKSIASCTPYSLYRFLATIVA
jgi:hypothetical protein